MKYEYEYIHMKFPDLDSAVAFANQRVYPPVRMVGFTFHHYKDLGEWSVVFETEREQVNPDYVGSGTDRFGRRIMPLDFYSRIEMTERVDIYNNEPGGC